MGLEVKNMSSGYRQIPVLKDIDFSIEYGEIVGLIGLNGAGKSTLLKTILGLLIPQKGTITIDSHTILDDHSRYAQHIAYIPETPVLYEELTLKEHIEMTALGYNISVEEALKRAELLLKIFRLENVMNWFPIHFSKGMKQKVMIICALITDAKIFIIDEPFLGLDPLAIRDFIALLKKRASEGSAILFTTHMLSIADELCDSYLLLSNGYLVGQGNLTSLREQFRNEDASLEDIYFAMTDTKAPLSVDKGDG